MDEVALTRAALTTMRCTLCANLLTVPPISSISEDGLQNRCGRCQRINIKTFSRNVIFENIAQFMLLPCTYDNCEEKIMWDFVRTHERECPQRVIQCPMSFSACEESIKVTDIEEHFIQKHPHNVKYGNMARYVLKEGYSMVFFCILDDEYFFVYSFHYDDLFALSVFSVGNVGATKTYSVKLSSNGYGSPFITYEKQVIIPYDETEHCFRCLDEECDAKSHPYSSVYNPAGLKNLGAICTIFDNNPIQALLKTTRCITYTIIFDGGSKDGSSPPVVPECAVKYRDNSCLRRHLECPICGGYMYRRIFSCSVGHAFCEGCKGELARCPFCKAELNESRVFALEEIAESVSLPCQYEPNGCDFVGNVEQVSKHEMECSHVGI